MKSFKASKNVKYFSLMELVIVVAVMAVISGGVIAAYDGMQKTAAQGTAAKTIAELSSAIRNYTAINKTAPNNFDSMLAANAAGVPGTEVLAGFIPAKIAGKMVSADISIKAISALQSAGITVVRHLDLDANGVNDGSTAIGTVDVAGQPAFVGDLDDIDIPNRAFDTPRSGSSANSPKNRGRGFEHVLFAGVDTGTSSDLIVWKAGDGGINNIKIGAAADDQLICLGIGNNTTIVGSDRIGIDGAPTYGSVEKHEYSRYIALYNVGPVGAEFATARLQTVVDTRGDFLDEEMAEFSGQKQ